MRSTDMQAVDRLDADTTEVLLTTNGGQFNHRVTSPKYKVLKLYRVTLKHVADNRLCKMPKSGVLLHGDNETVAIDEVVSEEPTVLLVIITEGKYHQAKHTVATAGDRTERLHCEKLGDWSTDDLPSGS